MVDSLYWCEASFGLRGKTDGELEQTSQLRERDNHLLLFGTKNASLDCLYQIKPMTDMLSAIMLQNQETKSVAICMTFLAFCTHLNSVGYCQACICRGDLSMHEDNHQCCDTNKCDTDHIQTHSKPAHCAAEQIKRGLVLIQQLPIPEENQWRTGINGYELVVRHSLFKSYS